MARIVSIVYKPANVERKPADHYARLPIGTATLVVGAGIQGDTKGRVSGNRELNVMFAETMADLAAEGFQIAPGALGEQIIVEGLDRESAVTGTKLRIGTDAVIELTMPRVGCSRFEHIQGLPKGNARGRMGFIARVVEGGDIALGDEVITA